MNQSSEHEAIVAGLDLGTTKICAIGAHAITYTNMLQGKSLSRRGCACMLRTQAVHAMLLSQHPTIHNEGKHHAPNKVAQSS